MTGARYEFRYAEQVQRTYTADHAEVSIHCRAEVVQIAADPIGKDGEREDVEGDESHFSRDVDRRAGPHPSPFFR